LTTGDVTTSSPLLDTSSPAFLPKAHGGIGPVYQPLAGSPLLNRVSDGSCFSDQRRATRFNGAACAAGSVDTPTVYVVVGNTGALTAGDNNILTQLRAVFGTSAVTVVGDTWNGSATPSAFVIAGSVNDAHVGTHFQQTGRPVVVLKQTLFDEMNMTNAASNEGTTNSTTLRVNGDIAGAAGYSSGGYNGGTDPTLTSSSQAYGWGNNLAGASANVFGTMPSNGANGALFQYYPFQPMFHNFSAPGARIGFFATNGAAAALNTAGNRLLQETVLAATTPF
jgi:hypothetical protein